MEQPKPYTAYRDSGVGWLEEIPQHWKVKRLKYFAPISGEKLDGKPDELTYLGLENVESKTGRLLLDAPVEEVDSTVSAFHRDEVLFGKLRPYLAKVVHASFDGVCTSELLVLQPDRRQVEPRFLFYRLLSNEFIRYANAFSYGVKMPRTSPQLIANTGVPLPSLPEQQTIAAFLDRETERLDASAAKKEQLIGLLQEQRSTLISHAVTKGLNPEAPMKDSGIPWLGRIPEHWKPKRLKHISPRQNVGVVVNPSSYYADAGVPFLFGGDISEGKISTDSCRRISPEDSRRLSDSLLHSDDLVTVRVGYPGVTAVIPPDLEGCNCASMMVVRRSPRFDSRWLCYAMNSRIGRSQVEIVQYGAAQEQFNIAHAVEFRFAFPPKEEQTAIADYLDQKTNKLDALIARTRDGIAALREYRTALISAAVTGKIAVNVSASH